MLLGPVNARGSNAQSVWSPSSLHPRRDARLARTHTLAQLRVSVTLGHGCLWVSGMRPAFSLYFHIRSSLGTALEAAL